MDYQDMIENMTPQVYDNLKRAVEVGKWPDGRPLSGNQREEALQAIIAWGQLHLPEQERVGFIDRGHKEGQASDSPDEQTLNWKE